MVSSYQRRSASWRARSRWDTRRTQVNGFVREGGYSLGGGSAGMWGDPNDVISKACGICADSAAQIPSNPINALCIELVHNLWALQPVCRRGTWGMDGRSFTIIITISNLYWPVSLRQGEQHSEETKRDLPQAWFVPLPSVYLNLKRKTKHTKGHLSIQR